MHVHVHVHVCIYIKFMAYCLIRNYQDLLLQGETWERSGEYSRAVEMFLQVTVNNCDDQELLIQAWNKVRYKMEPLYS